MPISAQEWRVRTGMHNSSKRVWLNTQRNTRYPNHGTKKSAKEALLNSPGVWSVTLTTMIAPFLPRVYTILIYILKMLITSGGGAVNTMGSFRLSNVNNTGYILGEPNFSWINIDLQQLPGVQWLPQARGLVAILYIATLVLCSIALLLTRHKKVQRKITILYEPVIAYDIQGLKMDRVLKHTSAFNGVAVISLGLVSLTSIVISLLLIMAGDVETNPGPQNAGATGDYNFAHKTLVDCGEKIVHGLSMDPKQIATSLHSRGFIADSTYEKIIDSTLPQTTTDKARCLHMALLNKVKEYPQKYEEFIQLLEKNKRLHSDLLEELQETYQRNSSKKPQDAIPANVLKYAEHLKQHYLKELIFQDEPWPPSLGQQYTNLALIEHDKKTHIQQEDLLRGNIDQIQKEKRSITEDKMFTKEGKPIPSFRVLMDGAPGVGKTTLCRKICQDWAEGKILQECCLLVYIPLRDRRMARALEIEKLFYHDNLDILHSVTKHVRQTQGATTCFIFDGFDELNKQERERESLFLDIFKGNILCKSSVLVSSRPYASDRIQRMGTVTRHVEVLGFNREQIEACIKNKISEKQKAFTLVKQLRSREELVSLCYIPLNCAILIHVYTTENYTLPMTITELFELFISNTYHRQTDIQGLSKQDFKNHLCTLSELAFKSLVEEKLTFDREEVPEHEAILGLMTATKSFLSSGMPVVYQFIHLTIHEYLAAKWISSKFTEEQQAKFLKKNLLNDRFRMVLIFLAGITKFLGQKLQQVVSTQKLHLYMHHSDYDESLDITPFKMISNLVHLAYESQNPKFCLAVANTVEGGALKWKIQSEFLGHTIGYFIAQSGCTWAIIELEFTRSVSPFFQQMQTALGTTSINKFVVYHLSESIPHPAMFAGRTFKQMEYLDAEYSNLSQPNEPPLNVTDHLSELRLKYLYFRLYITPAVIDYVIKIMRNCKTLQHLELATNHKVSAVTGHDLARLINEVQHSSIRKLRINVNCLLGRNVFMEAILAAVLHSSENTETVPDPKPEEILEIYLSMGKLLLKKDLCSLSLLTTETMDESFLIAMPNIIFTPLNNAILHALTFCSNLKQLSITSFLMTSQSPRQLTTMLSTNNSLHSLTICIENITHTSLLQDLVLGLKSNTTLRKLVVNYRLIPFTDTNFLISLCECLRTQSYLEVLVIQTWRLNDNDVSGNYIPKLLLYNSCLSVVKIFANFKKHQLKKIARCLVLNGKRKSIELELHFYEYLTSKQFKNDLIIQEEVERFKTILFSAMIKLLAHVLAIRQQ